MLDYPIIIHVPHSSTYIPEEFRNQFIISQSELAYEIEVMTDHYTDEMVSWSNQVIRFDIQGFLLMLKDFGMTRMNL